MLRHLVLLAALCVALPTLSKNNSDDHDIKVTINGTSISPSDPNFYYYLQIAAAQAMSQTNKQPDEENDEPQDANSKKRNRKRSRQERNNKEDAKFIQTMGVLASGIAQTAVTGNPAPAIMSTFNAVASMVKN